MIRPYKNSDKPSLLKIMKALIPKYFAAGEFKDYEDYLDNRIEQYFIFETDGKVVAGAGINVLENIPETRMSWDLVDPEYFNKGIGTQLLNYRILWAENLNANPIIVRTSQMAYKFYQRSGFELLEIKIDYWAEGYDLYLMKYNKQIK